MEATITHLIITRFCIRFMQRAEWFHGPSISMTIDPLTRENLAFRSLMLRSIALPSIAAQTSQNFKWIIMIEPDTPDDIQLELRQSFIGRSNIHLHELQDNDALNDHRWLESYIPDDTTHLITTHLDDDDALAPDFVLQIQKIAITVLNSDEMPLAIFGTQNVIQWDMDFTHQNPFGTYTAKWHRTHHKVVSCGLTVAAVYPSVPLYIVNMSHSRVHLYKDAQPTNDHNINWVRNALDQTLKERGADLHMKDLQLVRYDRDVTPCLMTNHGKNLQVNRIHELKSEHISVTAGQRFREIEPDWELIKANRQVFSDIPDWTAQSFYRIPPWKRPNRAPFPKNILLYLKWHAQYLLRGKEYYYEQFYAMRFKKRPRGDRDGM